MQRLFWAGLPVILILFLVNLFRNFRGFSMLFRAAQVDRMTLARARTETDRAIVIANALVQQITLVNWRLRRSVEYLGRMGALTPEEQEKHYARIEWSIEHTWCDGKSFEFCLPTLKVTSPFSSAEVAKEYADRMCELTTLREGLVHFDRFFGRYRQ